MTYQETTKPESQPPKNLADRLNGRRITYAEAIEIARQIAERAEAGRARYAEEEARRTFDVLDD